MKLNVCVVLVLLTFVLLRPSMVSADPLTDGNILVIQDNSVHEFTLTGTWVQTFEVPYVGSSTITVVARDSVVAEDGKVHIYNGTAEAYLTTLDPATSTYEHRDADGISTANNGTFGGVAIYGNFVFVTDMDTGGSPAAGIVRFDLTDGSFVRFQANIYSFGENYSDVTVGENGILYANNPRGGTPADSFDMFDPVTLEHLGRIPYTYSSGVWSTDIRGIDADRDGNVYVVGWSRAVFKLDPAGNLLKSLYFGDEISPTGDIDVSENGTILVGTRSGDVIVTSTDLDSYYTFTSPVFGGSNIGVAFTKPRSFTIPPPREAVIDVDPSSTENEVKFKGKLKPLYVALLGASDLDVENTIDRDSALLGDPLLVDPTSGTGVPVPAISFSVQDVNGDSIADMVFEFDVAEMLLVGAIDSSSQELLLNTQLHNGGIVYGVDAINQSPGNGKGGGNGKSK
jgi:hypothetical protein